MYKKGKLAVRKNTEKKEKKTMGHWFLMPNQRAAVQPEIQWCVSQRIIHSDVQVG